MGLSVGIAGLPNVGKSTLLNALSHAGAEASNYPFCTIEQNIGVAPVPDPNLGRLEKILTPEEAIPTTIKFVDIAGLVKGASKGEGLGNKFLGHIREADALLHVVRCFDAPNIVHATDGVDPLADVEIVETEFLLSDLEAAQRARHRIDKDLRVGKKDEKATADVLDRVIEKLKEGVAVSAQELSDKDWVDLGAVRFLTAKPCLYLANTGEDDPHGEGPQTQALIAAKGADQVIPVSVEIEEEISELPPEEQTEFLKELGLDDTALDLVVTGCYRLLDLITFYTIANNKLRAWQLPRGGTASQAAGRVHSDMEKGFIRAEVMALDDLVKYGDRHALHDHGLIHAGGRDYEVHDKDVLQFHFKV